MESISRISSLLETARDLTLEAASASALRKTSARPLPAVQLKKLLDSRHEREVLEGLRRVIMMTYRQQPTLPYFSNVIKNIASPSLEVKKLVYIYLVHHAEAEPDTALLSINTIQKTLSDSNPQLRALALRVMSSIRVPVISQIVSLGIKRGTGDMSPYVRKAAALAIPKCYRLDPNTMPQLLENLTTLLGDKQYFVAGAAVASFLEICPDRLDLIHPHYRSLVRKLVDMDEWGQISTMRLMLVYARKCFPRRTRRVKKAAPAAKTTKGFYDEESEDSDAGSFIEEEIPDPDLTLLLNSTLPLLQSRNSSVILSVARLYLYLSPQTHLPLAVGPLIALLRSSPSIQQIALRNITSIASTQPQYAALFVKHYIHFLLRPSTESQIISRLKLEMLALIFPHAPPKLQNLILAELSHFARSSGSTDSAIIRDSVRAIGRCAQLSADPATSDRCLRLLLSHLSSPNPSQALLTTTLLILRTLILSTRQNHQDTPETGYRTIIHLARHLDITTSPHARASIIWLVGEYASVGDVKENIAFDVLRILLKGFADEDEVVKGQILLLAAKSYVAWLNSENENAILDPEKDVAQQPSVDESAIQYPEEEGGFRSNSPPPAQAQAEPQKPSHPIALLYTHTLHLTRYDTSYDLRDRARLFRALLPPLDTTNASFQSNSTASTALATLLLQAPKPIPAIASLSAKGATFTLGSASLIISDEAGDSGVPGYEDLAVPEWVRPGEEPDPKLRDEASGASTPAHVGVPSGIRVESAAERLEREAQERERGGYSGGASPSLGGGFGAGMGAGAGIAAGTNGFGQKAARKEKTLDDWLAEDDDGEEESEEETDEEETDEEDETEEEETDEEEEESSEDEGEGARLVR